MKKYNEEIFIIAMFLVFTMLTSQFASRYAKAKNVIDREIASMKNNK